MFGFENVPAEAEEHAGTQGQPSGPPQHLVRIERQAWTERPIPGAPQEREQAGAESNAHNTPDHAPVLLVEQLGFRFRHHGHTSFKKFGRV